jgi:hypothetical protein
MVDSLHNPQQKAGYKGRHLWFVTCEKKLAVIVRRLVELFDELEGVPQSFSTGPR